MMYLFIFKSRSYYIACEESFKEALKDCASYVEISDEIFLKCLDGFSEDDYEGLVKLFNKFKIPYENDIKSIYEVKRKIF